MPTFLSLLEEFSNKQEHLKQDLQNALKQNLQDNEYEALFKTKKYNIQPVYSELVGHSSKIINVELKELLIRPLQDCFKIKDYISKGYSIDKFILIDNKNGVHADINIADNFPLTKPDYVGVSRLACGYCHDYLSKKEILHRGTHGIIDPKWKMNLPSPEEEDFKENILKHTQEVEKGSEPIQHRRLSFDYFEKDILIGNDQTLCRVC